MRPIGSLFLAPDADRDRLPVVLLSGFLGSGKTTFVNALLRDPAMARTAVAVNEFGAIPLDAELIDHGADKTVVMANGCLCCNLAGDMEEAVMRLFSRSADAGLPAFERLIIEPSGLADPAPIAQGILRNPVLSRALRLESIITMVDAVFALDQLVRHPETVKQVAMADRIVLTKSDLVSSEDVDAVIAGVRRFNQIAPIVVASHGVVNPAAVLPERFLQPGSVSETDVPARAPKGFFAEGVGDIGSDHARGYTAIELTADRPLDWHAFDAWFRSIRLGYSEQLLRAKGILDVFGARGPVVVQGVHHVMHAPVELAIWPAVARGSRLVLIVDAVVEHQMRDSWQKALPGLFASLAA